MSRELKDFSTMIDERFELADTNEPEGFWEFIVCLFIWSELPNYPLSPKPGDERRIGAIKLKNQNIERWILNDEIY